MFDGMVQRLSMNSRVAKRLAHNQLHGTDRGQMAGGAKEVIALVIALTVGAIVAAFLLPVGLDELVGVDTSNYSSGAQSLWDILDVIVVLALFLFFIAVALGAADRV